MQLNPVLHVQMAILGIDFLIAFKQSVDPAAGKLVQDGTGLTLSRGVLLPLPQSEANKSANRCGNFRAKGGVVPPSVYT